MPSMEQSTETLSAWGDLRKQLGPVFRKKLKKYRCGFSCWKSTVFGAFPILDWLFHYDLKACLIGDLLSGCTVGILNIPQGMAYGVLANTEAINGLYTSFFPVLIYSILCTSKHASVGTFAVTSLMAGGIVSSIGSDLYAKTTSSNSSNVSKNSSKTHEEFGGSLDPVPIDIRVNVMIAVTLSVGLWQVIMGIFRLGFLAVLLSDHLVRGFTCAAAFHVFTSQVPLVFGVPVQERYGALKLIYFYTEFFSKIHTTHIPTLIVSIICITILYLTRTFINQNQKVVKIIRIPVPIELLVIIFATLASYYLDLSRVYKVRTVRNIPLGLPASRMPPYAIIPEILGRTFSLAVVASAVLISLAKIFATKHHYKIDPNKELIAIGASNIFGSFFLCIPATGALARSALQESAGGSTQIVGLVSALVVLIVLLAVGKFLQPLPRAALGSIIMVALINMLKPILDLKRLWHISLIDASIFLVTVVATLLLDVDSGLAVGVLYSLMTFFFRFQYRKIVLLGKSISDGLKPLGGSQIEELPGVKIYKIYGALYSGNAESFASKIRQVLDKETRDPSASNLVHHETAGISLGMGIDDVNLRQLPNPSLGQHVHDIPIAALSKVQIALSTEKRLGAVIVDFSSVSFVDVVAAQNLTFIAKECKKNNVKFIIAGCIDDVRDMLFRTDVSAIIPKNDFIPTVAEALNYI